MIAERSVLVVGLGLVLGFLLSLYGFFCMLSAQAYLVGPSGKFFMEGLPAVFAGLMIFGFGSLGLLQSIGYMEYRYRKPVTLFSIVAIVAIVAGLIAFLLLPPTA